MLAVNQVLQNRYRIIRQLGEGGMGAVYEAEDNQRFGKSVALKEILLNLTQKSSEHFQLAFEREAKILTQIDHEAVPRIFAYFHETNRQFLVMELIEGDDLDKILERRQKAFPLENVLQWMNQLLDALDYLHTLRQPIIHRDIKPQNLKLTRRGKIKLLDFGIAKDTEAELSATKSAASHKTFIGATLYYSPIEQVIRIPEYFELLDSINSDKAQKLMRQPADARTDIYALGATVYNLLTNDFPKPAHVRTLEVWTGKPDSLKPLHEINHEISPEFSVVIQQAMEIERKNRFSSASEMQAALLDAISLEKRRKDAEERNSLMAEQESIRREREELEAERRELQEERLAQIRKKEKAERERLEKIEYEARLKQWQEDNLKSKDISTAETVELHSNQVHSDAETVKNEDLPTQLLPLAGISVPMEDAQRADTFDWAKTPETKPFVDTSAPIYKENIEYGNNIHNFKSDTIANTPQTAPAIPVQTETAQKKMFWAVPLAIAGLFIFGIAAFGAFLLLRTTGDSGAVANKVDSQLVNSSPSPSATATANTTANTTPTATPEQGTATGSTPKPAATPVPKQKLTPVPTVSRPQITTPQPTKPPKTPDRSDDCVYNGKCRN